MARSTVWLTPALALLATAALAGADPWEDTKAYYEREGASEALSLRARAFDRLARTSGAKGLRLLMARYRSPERPHPDEERVLIGGSLRWVPGDVEAAAALGEWVAKMRGRDPWLELNALCSLDPARSLELAADADEEPWRRAAAAVALARTHPEVGRVVETLAGGLDPEALPRRDDDLALLVGGFGDALLELQTRLLNDPMGWGDSELDPLVDALLGVAAKADLPDPARALLERRLQRFERARGELAAERGDEDEGGGTRTGGRHGPASFMGITVEGRARIVYVLDLSDSMLEPLRAEELERLRETARRGPRTGDGADREPEEADPDRGLPWDRIRTRFDAAREFLKRSLRELDPETEVAVVVFGDDAELLSSTPKLVEAGRAARAVARELDGVRPGPAKQGRPNGTLRGQTNLHAAMRLAFQVSTRGVRPLEKAVSPDHDPERLADTIFVLSDGEPTKDDFPGKGPEREVQAGTVTRVDPETGSTSSSQTEGGMASSDHEGPYRDLVYFRRDLERLELFRWAQIHVVGLGECDETWAEALVEIGEGELRIVGSSD